jgi:hypothetical protein
VRVRCAPLYRGQSDEHGWCGAIIDDEHRLTVCPHVSLAGGDTEGLGTTGSAWDWAADAPVEGVHSVAS